jgi:PAS domain S-box-containing protein
MKEKKKPKEGANRSRPLRKLAEEKLRAKPARKKFANITDLQRLVHELEIHQVELKLQNEELRGAQVELAASRDCYTDLYESAPVAYVTLDKDGAILQSNLMAAELLGVERQDLVRANLVKFVHSESQDDWYLHRQAALLNDTKQVCEIKIRRKDGTLLSIRAESIGVGEGNERRCRTAFVDLTELKRAENEREQLLVREQIARRELEAATKTKDRFLAMASHELRTPLTPILGWTGVLRGKPMKDVNVDYALDCIERNARMQAKLVEDLLDVSASLTGKMHLKFKPVDLHEIVNAAVDTVRPSADAKQIKIETLLERDAGQASGDSERLQQVMWNLLTNAVKFTPSGGQVGVQLVRNASGIQIIVSDTGEGIRADFLPYIFDPFSQADDTKVKSQRGLGLGLSIVHHIVQIHGGTVQVRSTEGEGSTFTVWLPAGNHRSSDAA